MTKNSTNNNKAGRSVSFRPWLKVHEILHVANYTDAELNACFYTSQAFKGMKLDAKYTSVGLIEPNHFIKEENVSRKRRRGLH
jgi:hypothetical protein